MIYLVLGFILWGYAIYVSNKPEYPYQKYDWEKMYTSMTIGSILILISIYLFLKS